MRIGKKKCRELIAEHNMVVSERDTLLESAREVLNELSGLDDTTAVGKLRRAVLCVGDGRQ